MNEKLKSNPYVYPYVPFENLANKQLKNNFVSSKKIDWANLNDLVAKIRIPQPVISGDIVGEKILSIFLDENYRFGPREYIEDNKGEWLKKFNRFLNKNEPLKFTILGFPFKVPVPLKTNRKYPDMGDVLALFRLKLLNDHIKNLYPPGGITFVFTEGVFGRFTGIAEETWLKYAQFLKELAERLNFSESVKFIDFAEMEKAVPDFTERIKDKVTQLRELFAKKDQEFMNKYTGAYESIYRIVKPESLDEIILLEVYNDELSDENISEVARRVRSQLRKDTHEAIFQYYAYLALRDDLDFINQRVPGALTLSVSPKPNRLGIIQVNAECTRLPHHGVTVYYPEREQYSIEYLIDIKRRERRFEMVFLEGDPDDKPFYYSAK